MSHPRFLLSVLFPVAFGLRMAEAADGGAPTPATASATPPASSGFSQADIDKAVQDALAKHQAEIAARQAEEEARKKGEYEKLLADRDAKLAEVEGNLAKTHIANALLAASKDAIDPETVAALLAGQAHYKDGAVTVDGKTPAQAVADFLKAKPFLAKAGPAGSGAPVSAGLEAGVANPWAKDTLNLTRQGQIAKENPTLAAQLKAQAGIK